eukprot:6041878-Amphidinium_carterae.1
MGTACSAHGRLKNAAPLWCNLMSRRPSLPAAQQKRCRSEGRPLSRLEHHLLWSMNAEGLSMCSACLTPSRSRVGFRPYTGWVRLPTQALLRDLFAQGQDMSGAGR